MRPGNRINLRFIGLHYRGGIEIVHARVPGHNDIAFFGKGGVVQVDRGRVSVTTGGATIGKGTQSLGLQLDQIEKEFLPAPKVRLYRSTDHLGDWLTAVRSRKPLICDLEIGARTATVCNLVNLTDHHGQTMKWDPSRDTFVGGSGDKAWLDVPRRAAWKLA